MPSSAPVISPVKPSTSYPEFKAKVNELIDWLQRGWPMDGDSITVTDSVGGRGRVINVDRASLASSVTSVPFGLVNVSDDTDQIIRVYRGTVTTPDGSFTPSGFSAGDDPAFTLTVTGETSGVVYLEVTVDNTTGEVLTAEDPAFDTTIPANTATSFYIELGSFSITDDVLTLQSNDLGALYFELCGGVSPVWGGFNDA